MKEWACAPRLLTAGEFERLFAPLAASPRLLLAVSGGPDSTALMRLAARWRHDGAGRPDLAVACVDHGLRPEGRAEAEAVVAQAASLGCGAAVLPWTGPKPSRAIQERARDARYALLIAHAARIGATHVVTAHTLDDQAETILFRLSRGTGIAGLAGIRPRVERGGLVVARPFLPVPKARLVATCRAEGWAYEEDPANANLRFARARWRRLVGQLHAEGLTAERLGQLADRAARVELALAAAVASLETAAALASDADLHRFHADRLAAAPDELLGRLLARSIAAVTGTERVRLERLETLATALRKALGAGQPLRRTLGGAVVAFGDGVVSISRESPRRRGMAR